MSRHLRKPIDTFLKGIAVILGMGILMLNDFDIGAIWYVLGAIMMELVLILILEKWGR